MRPMVAVFGSSQTHRGEPLWEIGHTCGRLLGSLGITVVTGGYGGVMEAVSMGAGTVGAHVVGITAPGVFTTRNGANPYVTEERAEDTLPHRLSRLVVESDASITLPGSIGTMAELMVAWNTAFCARFGDTEPKPMAAVGEPWLSLIPDLADRLGTDASLVGLFAEVEPAVAHVAQRLGV